MRLLEDEIGTVYRELVAPRWDVDPRHFARTLYAWYSGASQTQRMGMLLTEYLGADPEAAAAAVKLWRHTLMHTANPQVSSRSRRECDIRVIST